LSKPVVVTISHQLGQDEAIRRIRSGTDKLMSHLPGKVALVENTWSGNVLHFTVRAMAQTVSGVIEVHDDIVRVEARLPLLLAAFAERVKGYVAQRGNVMLERK
jgi:hypothetical protein